MNLLVKRLTKTAILPTKGTAHSAGYDLYVDRILYETRTCILAAGPESIWTGGVGFGIQVELPENTVGLIIPRSSAGRKGYSLQNTVGVIDSDYRGELKAYFNLTDTVTHPPPIGIRVAQLIVVPLAVAYNVREITGELSHTIRGSGGFGSTGMYIEEGQICS